MLHGYFTRKLSQSHAIGSLATDGLLVTFARFVELGNIKIIHWAINFRYSRPICTVEYIGLLQQSLNAYKIEYNYRLQSTM